MEENAGNKTADEIRQDENKNSYDGTEVIDGITVYKSYRQDGNTLWECLLQAMGKM